MGNLNWNATTPQAQRGGARMKSTVGGSSPSEISGPAVAVKKPMEPKGASTAKARADLAAGKITRQQFNAIVSKNSAMTGSTNQGSC